MAVLIRPISVRVHKDGEGEWGGGGGGGGGAEGGGGGFDEETYTVAA